MQRRSSIAWFIALLFAATFGAAYGCAAMTGIPFQERLKDFWRNDVVPLWKHGPNPDIPPPDMLKDIQPEPLPTDDAIAR